MISRLLLLAVQDDAVILGLEPLHGVLLGQPVGEADPPSLAAPVTDVHAGPSHHHVEVHAVDTNAGIILDAQVDVLLDTEAEVSVLGEVLSPQLVLLHLQATLENLLSLGAPDSAVDGDLLVPSDTKTTDSVSGFAEHRGLPCQRLKHLARPGQPVSGLSHADVEAELTDLEISHWVLCFSISHYGLLFLLSLVEVNQAIL